MTISTLSVGHGWSTKATWAANPASFWLLHELSWRKKPRFKVSSAQKNLGALAFEGNPVRFTYDLRYNIAYIRFQDKQSTVESIRVSDDLIVDMTPDGTVYGIELLNANEQLRRGSTEKLLVINESTGEHIELPLAVR